MSRVKWLTCEIIRCPGFHLGIVFNWDMWRGLTLSLGWWRLIIGHWVDPGNGEF